MKTEQAIQAALRLKQDHMLRSRLEKLRGKVQSHISEMQRTIEQIDQALTVEYTGHFALFKKEGDSWKCVACADSNKLPEGLTEDFDLCLPIPNPETMPEWEGW